MKCRSLDVWKLAVDVSSEIYAYLVDLRDFGFKDQLTRSGLSVPSNIAEGFERYSEKKKIRFLDIARGSIAEAQTQIIIGMRIGYIDDKTGGRWIDTLEQIGKMLTKLISSIHQRRDQ